MNNRHCPECWAIRRQLGEASRQAHKENERKLGDWLDAGKSLRGFYSEWLASADLAGDREAVDEWRRAQPGLAEALRRKAEHEVLTGHSVYLLLFPVEPDS